MKKIGFVTKNNIFAQSLATAIKIRPELDFKFFPLINPYQVELDIEILKIDVAIIDLLDAKAPEIENILLFCEKLRKTMPTCKIFLLVPQYSIISSKAVMKAIEDGIADEVAFYDTSLEYLFAKLATL